MAYDTYVNFVISQIAFLILDNQYNLVFSPSKNRKEIVTEFFHGKKNVHYLNIFYIACVEEAVIIYEIVKRQFGELMYHIVHVNWYLRRDFIFGKNSFDIIYILVVKVGKSIQLKQR